MNEVDTMLNERSKRLRIARAISGMTRESFSHKYNISMYTLRSCELGNLAVSYKTADKVSKALEQEGIFCTIEWIMEGKGQSPTPHRYPTIRNTVSSLEEEEAVLREMDFFRKLYDSTVILKLTDDAMAPLYKAGDVVGGKLVDNHDQLVGKTCLVEIKPEHFILRKIVKDENSTKPWILTALNPESKNVDSYLRLYKMLTAAPVLWTRRTLTSALA